MSKDLAKKDTFTSWIDEKTWQQADLSVFGETARIKFNLEKIGRSGQYLQNHNYLELLKICKGKIKLNPTCNILELGAGVGAFTTVLRKMYPFAKISSLDYSKGLVQEVMPRVFKFMGIDVNSINRIHGSFDRLKLENETVDLVIANCAFHHADNIEKVCSESFRVLKKNKFLILFERVHHESITDNDIDKMLNKVKSASRMYKQFGVPKNTPVTRKMLGEHEYRGSDWLRFLFNAGFSLYYFDFNPQTKYFTENVVKLKKIVFKFKFLRSICLRIPYLKKYFFEYRNLSLIILKKL